ncbi:MAG TPA: Hsp20/alpha crystallin family protein [Candidatus Kapabacteria bacterium]|nr:Hsp20/alpha crystallin family protein [Candidatus Kapabacteria bacterium]
MGNYRFNQNFDLDDVLNQINHWANKFDNEFSYKKNDNVKVTDFSPVMDIYEQGATYVIEVELPGIDKSNVKININEDGILSISGSKVKTSDKESNKLRQERKYGEFSRSLQLAEDIDTNKIDARFDNGILILTINKKEPATPKVVEVKIS